MPISCVAGRSELICCLRYYRGPMFRERSPPQELEKKLKLTLPWTSTRMPIVSVPFPHALSSPLYAPYLVHHLPPKRQIGVLSFSNFLNDPFFRIAVT